MCARQAAAAVVIALWLPYVVLNSWFPNPAVVYLVGLTVAVLAIAVLIVAGDSPDELFLRPRPTSRAGAAVLVATLAVLPAAVAVGRGHGFEWLGVFVYAPASALGQELYFRCALFRALARYGVAGQAIAFTLWHARAFWEVAVWQALLVLLGAFVAALVWGWQVRRDRTVLYAVLHHTLFLAVL